VETSTVCSWCSEEGKGREGKGREGNVEILKTATYAETEYKGGFMNFMEE